MDRQKSRANSRIISAMQIDGRRTPAEILATGPELRTPRTAAQTRMVSVRANLFDHLIFQAQNVGMFCGQLCNAVSEIRKGIDRIWTRYFSLNCMATCSNAGFHSSCWLRTNAWASVGLAGCT